MKQLFRTIIIVALALTACGARAGTISDVGTNAYWGGDDHGKGDLIGASVYDINSATITRVGSVLTVSIATNFAGHAGTDSWSTPGGIAYGDVFLSQTWNPFGADSHHLSDNSSNSTVWSYGLSLDNRWSNTGGTFKLYKLNVNGQGNSKGILNSENIMSCVQPTQCTYRNGQEVAVDRTSTNVSNTYLTGTWTVTADQELRFSINIGSSADLMSYTSMAIHWGETCQNDVIEGLTRIVPTPGSLPLVALGLCGMFAFQRRRVQLGRV
jgi:hypothetical protein